MTPETPGGTPTTAVVLGGTGWIGRHVTAAFVEAGHDVVVVATRPPSAPLPGVRAETMDLVEAGVPAILALLDAYRPAVVVNAAGRPWGATPSVMRATLLTLTEQVLAAVAGLRHRPRLVQVGTVMEYGPTTEGAPITERTPCRPAGAYGRIKLAASAAVLAAARSGAVDATVLRLVNITGPGTAPTSLLGRVLEQQLAAHRAGTSARVVLTPLHGMRDYIDVRDGADAVYAAAHARDLAGTVVNIGSGAATPVRSLVDTLISATGVPTELVEREPAAGGPVSPGAGGDWLAVDTTLAAEQLGWKAHRDLRAALRDDWDERAARPGEGSR